jgi:acyl transferase domain-containing protein
LGSLYKEEERQLIALPSYVFDRKQCWIDPHKVINRSATITNSTPNSISNRNENNDEKKPSLAKLPLL